MLPRNVFYQLILLMFIALPLAAGCASTSYIEITYQLPEPQQNLTAKTVSLQVVDQRSTDAIAGPHARTELEYFTGLFSLYMTAGDKQPELVGAFDLTALFREALKKRLESEGVTVLDAGNSDQPALEVRIKAFILDRDGKNWKASLAYTATASKAGRELTNQTVSGNAERLKIVGTRDAEKLLGDIFSDMVNRLDPEKLLNHPDF